MSAPAPLTISCRPQHLRWVLPQHLVPAAFMAEAAFTRYESLASPQGSAVKRKKAPEHDDPPAQADENAKTSNTPASPRGADVKPQDYETAGPSDPAALPALGRIRGVIAALYLAGPSSPASRGLADPSTSAGGGEEEGSKR